MNHLGSPQRRAFTLMELLVVIAIVGVLVGLLLPTFGKVRKAAQGVKCMSNMKAIGTAWRAYAVDNKGATPMTGDFNSPAGNKEDWLHWQPTRKLDESSFAKYLGKPLSRELFICPLDETEQGTRSDAGGPRYPFSYSMNVMMCNYPYESNVFTSNFELTRNMKMSKINNPAAKVVIVDESHQTINDTAWAPKIMPSFPRVDWISNRHGTNRDKVFNSTGLWRPNGIDMDGTSNAIFADGHAEVVTRKFAHDPLHFDPKK